jgi:hypothetical protein
MLLDTDVTIDLLRDHPPAVAWISGLGSAPIGLPGLVAMELLQGCKNQGEQRRLEGHLRRYPLHWPTDDDCRRAFQDFAAFRLGFCLGLLDSLIGQTAVGLGEVLATFNVKHDSKVTGLATVQPY